MHIIIVALIVLAVICAFLLIGFMNLAHHRMRRYGWFLYAWRWFSGSHWDGHLQTDAGWRRRGQKALTQTKFAGRFYFRPRWERSALRTGFTLGLPAALLGAVANLQLTIESLAGCALLALVWAAWKAYRAWQAHTLVRDWMLPLHQATAELADMPLSAKPSSWLEVSADRRWAKFNLPAGYNATENQQERLVTIAAKKLGMESPEPTWQPTGKEPSLILSASESPPPEVYLTSIKQAIENAKTDELVVGLGKKSKPVTISLHDDSPHIGASMRGGAGKSTMARFLASQALHKGAIVLILDLKVISHPWARGLPNVMYADDKRKIHDALVWMGGELERRNDVARYSVDVEANVVASVGPRIFIIAEELNMTLGKLRTLWMDEMGGQGLSPAILALQDVAFAGRQVRMNLFMIGQMLSARATGGGEARENVGARILSKYTKRNWDMLVPEFVMPPVSPVLGRVQVVTSGEVRETQVANITGREARNLAMSGIVAKLPHDVPKSLVTVDESDNEKTLELPISPLDLATESNADPIASRPMTLSEALNAGLIKGNINTIRSDRQRDKAFPQPVDRPPDGKWNTHYYDPVALADWEAQRGKRGKR